MSQGRSQKSVERVESPVRNRSGTRSQNRSQSTARQGIQRSNSARRAPEWATQTRRCTPVVWIGAPQFHESRMDVRPVVANAHLHVQPFAVQASLEAEVLRDMATGMLEEEEREADIGRGARPQRRVKDKQTWRDRVNSQRDATRADLESGRVRSLDQMVERLGG